MTGKKRKNKYAKLNIGRWRRFIYIKDYLEGERNSMKSKQRNKCIKNNNRFKKIKLKKKIKRKTPQNCKSSM